MTANINDCSNNINNSSRSIITMERRQPSGVHSNTSGRKSKHTTKNANADEHGLSFPLKLHTMLEDSDKKGFSNVVSWQPGDKSFKVHNVNQFGNEIMP
jgi:hypothetical protein